MNCNILCDLYRKNTNSSTSTCGSGHDHTAQCTDDLINYIPVPWLLVVQLISMKVDGLCGAVPASATVAVGCIVVAFENSAAASDERVEKAGCGLDCVLSPIASLLPESTEGWNCCGCAWAPKAPPSSVNSGLSGWCVSIEEYLC